MAQKIQPEIVSREYVIPSNSISHNHPSIHILSFFDKQGPAFYSPLIFFYTSRDSKTDPHLISSSLKSSLSIVLSHYYPLAGRMENDDTVNCNDNGALFLEARMECHLSEILTTNLDFEALDVLCPDGLCYKDSSQFGPIVVQVTYFNCGGMSIGLCLCHRLMDMATMSSFINDWASLAREPNKKIVTPKFNIGSLYPPLDLPLPTHSSHEVETKKLTCRRFVFPGSKIADLKRRLADQVPNPTRVEVVSALLHQSALNAVARKSSLGTLKSSVMYHAINLRTHITPPLSSRNKGNMAGMFQVSTPESKEVTIGFLLNEFRKSKSQFLSSFANVSSQEELINLLILRNVKVSAEHEVYICTSWCRFQHYESDFGWGKPLWVGSTPPNVKNIICLTDTREGDGIEVQICLEDEVMAEFEKDEQLLSFCTTNPSIMDV